MVKLRARAVAVGTIDEAAGRVLTVGCVTGKIEGVIAVTLGTVGKDMGRGGVREATVGIVKALGAVVTDVTGDCVALKLTLLGEPCTAAAGALHAVFLHPVPSLYNMLHPTQFLHPIAVSFLPRCYMKSSATRFLINYTNRGLPPEHLTPRPSCMTFRKTPLFPQNRFPNSI